MEFSAGQIAHLLGGNIIGDAETKVSNLSRIEEGTPGTLSFLANPKYQEHLYSTRASIIIVSESLIPASAVTSTLIVVPDAYACFAKLLEMYNQVKNDKKGIEQPSFVAASNKIPSSLYLGAFAYIGENVTLGENVKIYPHAFIGDNCSIGDNTTIFSGCRIYSETKIGKHCTIHSGVVIGSDGFGFAPNSENNYQKVPQIGNVVIEDHVEIGSNTTIDRATLGSTIIRKGVKLDNLIQIAHNVEIGENTVIAAQSGVAGSTKIGKDCMIGGQVGIVGHLTIADGTKVAAQSGIGQSISKKGEIVQGSPAFGIGEYKRSYVVFRNLPKIKEKLDEMDKLINQISKITIQE